MFGHIRRPYKPLHLDSSGCLADTGFRQIKVNFPRQIINVFMCLLYKEPCLYCLELHKVKLITKEIMV